MIYQYLTRLINSSALPVAMRCSADKWDCSQCWTQLRLISTVSRTRPWMLSITAGEHEPGINVMPRHLARTGSILRMGKEPEPSYTNRYTRPLVMTNTSRNVSLFYQPVLLDSQQTIVESRCLDNNRVVCRWEPEQWPRRMTSCLYRLL